MVYIIWPPTPFFICRIHAEFICRIHVQTAFDLFLFTECFFTALLTYIIQSLAISVDIFAPYDVHVHHGDIFVQYVNVHKKNSIS